MAPASEPARSRQAWHNLALSVSATGDVAIAVANRTRRSSRSTTSNPLLLGVTETPCLSFTLARESRHPPILSRHGRRLTWVLTMETTRDSKEEVVEFLPDTQAALDEYLSLTDPDLTETLAAMGSSATRIVPDCVGLSLCLYAEDITFTLVASSLVLAELDAMQYLDGGPCVDAVEDNRRREESVRDMLDENRWQLFARASAAAGVASTLSLPVLADGRVMGGINLYASSGDAFVGHHQELADALGASAVGAVTNADLGFHSRERAARAPGQLHDQRIIDVAVGILAAREHLDIEMARSHLLDAAARAGITVSQAAQVVVAVHHP
jgi:hypothetical protein